MRAALTAAAIAMTSCASSAGTIGIIATDGGGTVHVYDAKGSCVGNARAAMWISADGTKHVPGCWIAIGAYLQIAYADGDAVQYPIAALKTPGWFMRGSRSSTLVGVSLAVDRGAP